MSEHIHVNSDSQGGLLTSAGEVPSHVRYFRLSRLSRLAV